MFESLCCFARRPARGLFLATLVVSAIANVSDSHAQSASAGSDWNKVVEAAKKEGRVNFYTVAVTDVMNRLVAGFRKAYPEISVEPFRGVNNQVMPRLEQERASGYADGADVFMGTELFWFEQRGRDGELARLAGPSLQGFPSQYLRGGSIAMVGFEPYVIAYNKNLVGTPPKGYADFLRPDLKGKIGVAPAMSSATASFYEWLEKNQGPEYLQKLKDQNPKIYAGSATQLNQALGSGEIAIANFSIPALTRLLMAQGAPVDYVVPTPSLGNAMSIASFSKSKRSNAGAVFVDYVMSAEGQVIWHGGGASASPRGVKGSLAADQIGIPDSGAYTDAVVKKYLERWGQIFNK